MTERPHLSICIPTYNRASFLEATLARLAQMHFPFSVEVAVSDNASTDNTAQVVFDAMKILPNLRYHRQKENTGLPGNYHAACRLGRGHFTAYLADDDTFFPDQLIKSVAVVEADPDLAALYCPHQYWDFRSNTRYGQHWTVAQDTFFTRPQVGELLNFVVDNHINPEIGVYRTDCLHRVLRASPGAYWAFSVCADLVAAHKVGFTNRSHYKFDTRPDTAGVNSNGGRHIVFNAYHEIRVGLEYFVGKIYELNGQVPVPAQDARIWRERIDNYILAGIADTFLAQTMALDFLAAHDLAKRLEAGGRTPYDLLLRMEPQFDTKVAADYVLHCCAALSWVDTLLVHVTSPLAQVVMAMSQAPGKRGPHAAVATTGDLQAHPRPDRVAVLTDRGSLRGELIGLGYLPGLIFAEDEIRSQLSLSRPRMAAAAQ